ncbi:hypothetical protein [Erythrobacter rubeus]|uniref:Peptidase M10 metallopeptidase domain-containing protein n=1 Tax=Erythrobacter rubeus TaxID=2760803 RepID=A0ABR8KLE8_9SPHN|nr:hypothetical protein [Erythrobacter rubeus]MBD2841217.1 hypothetical protein [Erythrobacter rubeus]
MASSAIVLAAAFAGPLASAHAAQFELVYEGVPDEAMPSLQMAVDILAPCLVSDVPIRVRVQWIERGPSGFAYQAAFRNRDFLPLRDVWYPSALANAFAGERLADQDDINIFFSAKTDWYYAGEEAIGEKQKDMVGVMMHELGHGLGLSTTTFTPWQGDPISTLGMPNEYVDYFDYSFALNEQDGTPSVYDSLLRLADGRGLQDFENGSIDLTFAIANPTIHFTGPEATKANRGYPVGVVPLSLSHAAELPRQPEPMMADNGSSGTTRRSNDPLALAMLADLGWTIAPECRTWGEG